jgi:integrase
MNNIHFSIETRGGYIYANGKMKVSIRLFIGRTSMRYIIPTAEVRPEYWDKNRLRAKNRTPDYAGINEHIILYEQRAIEIIREYDRHRKILTFDSFRNELYNKGYEADFFEYADKFINLNYASNAGTKKGMKNSISKFKTFTKGSLSFGAMNKQLLDSYRNYCLNELDNQESTTDKSLKNISTIINAALEEGKISENPVLKMKFKTHPGRKDAIPLEAFILLDRYFHTEKLTRAERNGLGAYLFACCCGMRYGDIQKLTFKDFRGRNLIFTENKTGKHRNIEIIAPAFDYIDPKNKISEFHNVFRLSSTSSSPTNRILKEIAEIINERENNTAVPPEIHFHTSRCFFDNELMSLTTAETAAEITGHSIKMVLEHYTKVKPINKEAALQKFEDSVFAHRNKLEA